MRKNKRQILYYFFCFFILLFLFYYFYNRFFSNKKEFFDTPTPMYYKYWNYELQPYDLDPITTYRDSGNYNKIWRGRETSNKDLRIDDLPVPIFSRILPFYNQLNKADIGYVQKYYENIPLVKFDKKVDDSINDYRKNAEIINDDLFRARNKNIWINRTNEYNPEEDVNFPFISSGLDDVDEIVVDFLNRYNKNVFDQDFDKQNVHYSKYSLYKYKIIQKISDLPNPNYNILEPTRTSSNQKKINLYRIILVLVSNTSVVAPVIYLESYIDYGLSGKEEKERINGSSKMTSIPRVKYYNIDTIGTFATSDLFLAEAGNNLPEDKFNYMNIDYNKREKIVDNSQSAILRDNKIIEDKVFQYNLENQYACFNANPDLFNNLHAGEGAILTISNSLSNAGNADSRVLCESPTDWYGRPKPFGVWDKPCKEDKECLFYRANDNYPNEYGKCNKQSGYCELPVNMLHLGYHYYVQNPKHSALCYNCNTKEWKATTDLNDCCEEQKDRKKYPFLKSPDYAYRDDLNLRINYENQRKFLE